jgi:Zn-dependent protease with chaperone function
MATNFFERQDSARRQTTRLVVLFSLSVAAIIVAIYLLVAVGMNAADPVRHVVEIEPGRHHTSTIHRQPSLWQPELFLGVAAGTLIVIALGSLYKIAELSAGGEAVALMLGGRPVDPQTTDLAERRLLNVVEEMALASGVPVPPVYVLDNEASINAFAAGHQPGDAVVAVSAGTLQYLTREELQGVMAHEFSHILNGDMRLNLRLIGVVNGILVLAILGYYILRFSGTSSRGSDKNGAAAGMFLLGLAMVILGYLGVFFGNLIKSAISRQREYLADASAVQFTRYPGGIAGALKKIGGLSEGSQIRDAHAAEVSHMFFGNALSGSFFNLFATHPPLVDRIRALEPDFDGQFPEVEPVNAASDSERAPANRGRSGIGMTAAAAVSGFTAGATMPPTIAPRAAGLQGVDRMMADMPAPLLNAAREPFAAQALIFALLLSRDDSAVRARQLQMLQSQIEPPLFQLTQQLAVAAQTLPTNARLPLVDMTVPAIKRASAQQYVRFRQTVDALVAADQVVDMFEYCLRTVLFSYLDVHYGMKKQTVYSYWSISGLTQPLGFVLSMLAHVGNKDQGMAEQAFQAGAQTLAKPIEMLPLSECTLAKFDAALTKLSDSSPKVRRQIVDAVSACITADGQVTLEEGELLRAIAAALACPMPPI